MRCGGGVNHRMSLSDAALIKDNHVVAAGGVAAAFRAVRAGLPWAADRGGGRPLDQLEPVLAAGAELILLDNFTVAELARAVRLVDGRARLEASGGLTLESARDVAETGVDYLAVGALTHSAPALDIALDSIGRDVDAADHRRRQHPHGARPLRGRGGHRALADRHRRRAAPPTRSPCVLQGLLRPEPAAQAGRRQRHRAVLDRPVGAATRCARCAGATTATCPP